MFRSAFRPLLPVKITRKIGISRYLHDVTTDFVYQDTSGSLVTKPVSCTLGDPGQSNVLIYPEVGSALQAASPDGSAASYPKRCKLTFFHDLQYFGFRKCQNLGPSPV